MTDWQGNYFNYFTEIEEHFQRARGTGLFLLSPLDWALIETWKNSDVPLEAVLRGIDEAFAKWRARKAKTQAVNSLAYCAQAVARQAEEMAKGAVPAHAGAEQPPFPPEEIRAFLQRNAAKLEARFPALAAALREIEAALDAHLADLQHLDQRLTALEEKMIASLRAEASGDLLLAARQQLDRQLAPYRGKMSASQLAMLERQFLDRFLLENASLPRLSLFYL
jgi:hypothetical protein